jgi:hypothetical protein
MSIIFVTVENGVAEVDAKTVPAGFEVRVLDFDSLKENPNEFVAELDDNDRQYLDDRHPRQFTRVTDALASGSDSTCLDCGQVLGLDHECPEEEEDEEEEDEFDDFAGDDEEEEDEDEG